MGPNQFKVHQTHIMIYIQLWANNTSNKLTMNPLSWSRSPNTNH